MWQVTTRSCARDFQASPSRQILRLSIRYGAGVSEYLFCNFYFFGTGTASDDTHRHALIPTFCFAFSCFWKQVRANRSVATAGIEASIEPARWLRLLFCIFHIRLVILRVWAPNSWPDLRCHGYEREFIRTCALL